MSGCCWLPFTWQRISYWLVKALQETSSHACHQSWLFQLQILMRGQDISKREWKLVRGAVVEMRGNTYVGRLFFGDSEGNVVWDCDCRPSDALYMTLRVSSWEIRQLLISVAGGVMQACLISLRPSADAQGWGVWPGTPWEAATCAAHPCWARQRPAQCCSIPACSARRPFSAGVLLPDCLQDQHAHVQQESCRAQAQLCKLSPSHLPACRPMRPCTSTNVSGMRARPPSSTWPTLPMGSGQLPFSRS